MYHIRFLFFVSFHALDKSLFIHEKANLFLLICRRIG